MNLRPFTAFKRWDNEKQKWLHNHIEEGHLKFPKQALNNGESFKYEQGFLNDKNEFTDGSEIM